MPIPDRHDHRSRPGRSLGSAVLPGMAKTAVKYWSALFLAIAIIAAFLGFSFIVTGLATVFKLLFFIFLVLFLVSAAEAIGNPRP